MSQITILKSDNSFVDAFFVSSTLTTELVEISQLFNLDYLNLAFLHEIRARALSVCSRKIKTTDLTTAIAFTSAALDWFEELTSLINAISKLPNSHTLSICLQ